VGVLLRANRVDELLHGTLGNVVDHLRVSIAALGLLLTAALGTGPAAAQAGPAGAQAARDVPVSRALRLTFVGDIMGHDVNYHMEDFSDIYRGVSDAFRGDDLTFANLELPVDPTRPASGYPFFNGPPAYLRAALDAGIDVFSLANNHAFDGGVEGIFQTLRSVESLRGGARPFWVSGIRGNPRRPFLPTVFTVQGVRVGFLALSQFLNVPGGLRYVNVVDYGDEGAVEELLGIVRAARRQVDLLVVSWHGDAEYVQRPAAGKRRFFHRLLEAGAQVVFSHHPHVVQGYEIARGAAEGQDGLIMYSMGNFISGMTWRLDPSQANPPLAATGEAYILAVNVLCTESGCGIQDARPVFVADYRNARGEMVVGFMDRLADGSIPLGDAWRKYFAGRMRMMAAFLRATSG
jgi:poly-gamma-glutamate synthesis protein (capsule biosynthesis protein)